MKCAGRAPGAWISYHKAGARGLSQRKTGARHVLHSDYVPKTGARIMWLRPERATRVPGMRNVFRALVNRYVKATLNHV